MGSSGTIDTNVQDKRGDGTASQQRQDKPTQAFRTFKLSLRQSWLPDSASTMILRCFLFFGASLHPWSFSFSQLSNVLLRIVARSAKSSTGDRSSVSAVGFIFFLCSPPPPLVPRLHASRVSLDGADGRARAPGSVQIRSPWALGAKKPDL